MSAASDGLRNAALAMREAAQREGIQPHDPMWLWATSQETALNWMADLADEQEARVGRVVSSAKDLMDTQVAGLRTALQLAEQHNKRAQMASQHMQIQQETLVSRTVSDLTEQVSAKLSGALVLRQRRYDRVHFWGSIGLVTSLALALFFGGYGLHAYESSVNGALQRCMKTAQRNSAGVLFCEVRSVEGW